MNTNVFGALVFALLLGACAHAEKPMLAQSDAQTDKQADKQTGEQAIQTRDRVGLMGRCDVASGAKTDARARRTRGFSSTAAGSNARCYNQADIQRTGSVDVGEALRRLDPSVH